MIENSEIAPIGKFQKTHALKGELNAILDIDPDFFSDGNAAIVDMDGINVPFYVESVRGKGSFSYLVKLDGVDSGDEAKKFVNKIIYGLKSAISSYADDDDSELIYLEDLKGYDVKETDGMTIGVVDDVDDSTENALFIVATPSGEKVYIPAADDLIEELDHDKKIIVMDLPEGMINLNSKQED